MSEKIVGSVLVAGGGIAGMQAALDLGMMAKLDKTFPTNDCTM